MHSSSPKPRNVLHLFVDPTKITIQKGIMGGMHNLSQFSEECVSCRLWADWKAEWGIFLRLSSLPHQKEQQLTARSGATPMVAGRSYQPSPSGKHRQPVRKGFTTPGFFRRNTCPRRAGTLHFGRSVMGHEQRAALVASRILGSVSKLSSRKCI